MKNLLVVVDYQNDFVEGSLGFEAAKELEAGILQQVEATLKNGGYVLFTRDTHPEAYLKTREGQYLPIPHCIEDSEGHRLFGRLHTFEEAPQPRTAIINKPTFGCADIGKQAVALCEGQPDVVQVCGIVTDICVISNAILLHSFLPHANIQILSALCGSGNTENAAKALDILRGMGFEVIS